MRKLIFLLLVCLLCAPALAEEVALTTTEVTAADALAELASGTDLFPVPEDIFLAPGEEIIQTETSYKSQNISIEITTRFYDRSDVYIADIYVRSLANFQRVYAGGSWKKTTAKVATMSEESGVILSMTGDSGQNISAGWCIGNGIVWRETTNRKRDLAVLYKDGTFQALPAKVDYEALKPLQDQIWQTYLFGPVLLDENGKAMKKFNTSVFPRNPRSAIGYYAPGHYVFVQVDGRNTKSVMEKGRLNKGVDMASLSALMEELGCTAAYNLDGGRSSMMWFQGSMLSSPDKGGRRVGDLLVIKEIDLTE